MPEERHDVALGALIRWLVVGLVVLVGVGLYFALGRRTEPVVTAPALEQGR